MLEKDLKNEKISCSVMHTIHTLHNTSEKRTPVMIRMKQSIHRASMKYCASVDITAGQLYEEAVIMFMDLNPTVGINILVECPTRNSRSINDKLSSLICLQELNGLIDILRQNHEEGKEIHKNLLEKLKNIFSDYEKIKNPTEELVKIVDEVFLYIEK